MKRKRLTTGGNEELYAFFWMCVAAAAIMERQDLTIKQLQQQAAAKTEPKPVEPKQSNTSPFPDLSAIYGRMGATTFPKYHPSTSGNDNAV